MKIRKLKTVRLVLIVLAVVLAASTAGVGIFWLPAQQQAEPSKPPVGSASSTSPSTATQPTQPAETAPVTTAPAEENPFKPVIPDVQPQPSDGAGGSKGGIGRQNPDWGVGSYDPAAPQPPFGSEEGLQPGVGESREPKTQDTTGSGASDRMQTSGDATVPPETRGESGSNDIRPSTEPVGGRTAQKKSNPAKTVFVILCVLLAADLAGIVVVSVMISKEQKQQEKEKPMRTAVTPPQGGNQNAAGAGEIRIGQLHNIGARPYQEDSSGVSRLEDGVLAVVADGMGGLSGGDKVSQKIVYTMLAYGDQLRPGMIDGALERMVYGTNEAVNAMLGPEGLYKSGSTLLAALVRNNRFHWITVGDSHLYYFHEGKLIQLNEEHNRGTELLRKAAKGEITYEEARSDPKRNGLTSFIGMGKLKYIDKSVESIPLFQGDRIVLMTDGVFNALPDKTIEAVLTQIPDVQAAADEMERLVVQRANPRQDNFTAVILGF